MTISPSTSTRLAALSGAELAAGYADGSLSPVDVARDVVAAVGERNDTINAFTDFTPEQVLADAGASEARHRAGTARGPLDGVPVTVKENMHRVGVPFRSGTNASPEEISTGNTPGVDRLLEAGAVIVGSTTMPDWGMLSSGVSTRNGITRSPWNSAWTVGGSSSGAGAAAAAGWGAVHVGSDIGGSVRLPATWLGLATLKPSAGRVPHDAPYFGRALGPIARTVDDVARGMAVLSLPDARDYTALEPTTIDWTSTRESVAGLRIAVHTEAGAGMAVDPEVATLVRRAADHFAAAGAEVVEIPPFMTPELLASIDAFWRVRFFNTYLDLSAEQRNGVLPYIGDWALGGAETSGRSTVRYYEMMQEVRRVTVAATGGFDAVLSPVASVAAFPAEWPMPWGNDPHRPMEHIGFTVPYNMSGQPASSINCGFTADGRPVGLQIAGAPYADLAVLQLTGWYEATRPADAVPAFPVS